MQWTRVPRSLLITGVADLWTAPREGSPSGTAGSGLVLMMASAASFALMAAVVKKLLPEAPTQAVVLSRGVLMTAVFVALARARAIPLLGHRPGLLLLRGLFGYGALSCYFYSVQHLPLGDAVLLQYSHPIFVAAMAPLWLKERTSTFQWGVVLVALGGVALIIGPSGQVRPAAVIGVLGSFLSALAYISVRQLSRTEHPVTILIWFPLATILPSLAAVVAAGREAIPRDSTEVAGHLLTTLAALIGQVTLTLGLSRTGVASATTVTLIGPVFGMAFGYLLFGTVPEALSLAGAVIVLASLTLLGRGRG